MNYLTEQLNELLSRYKKVNGIKQYCDIFLATYDYMKYNYEHGKYRWTIDKLTRNLQRTQDIEFIIDLQNKNSWKTNVLLSLRVKNTILNMMVFDIPRRIICDEMLYFIKPTTHLDISGSCVTDIEKFAKHLTTLRIAGTNIGDNDIKNCHKLKLLDASHNKNITTCEPFADTLEELDASRGCGITDDGLKHCHKIRKLDASYNAQITTCDPFADTLEDLDVQDDVNLCLLYGNGGIKDYSIKNCHNIKKLNAHGNKYITTCEPFAETLEELYASDRCCIRDEGLINCHKIKLLDASANPKITTCEPFADTLEELDARYECGINNKGLINCHNINWLIASYNKKITTCNPYKDTLRTLYVDGVCGINDKSLRDCHKIKKLHMSNNPNITTCEPFAQTLEELKAENNCGIDNNGLKYCNNIKWLNVSDNPKITTCKPFSKTLNKLNADYKNCGIDNDSIKNCNRLQYISCYKNDKLKIRKSDLPNIKLIISKYRVSSKKFENIHDEHYEDSDSDSETNDSGVSSDSDSE